MFSNQTILVAPLDWGLGHATRCVPLIRQWRNNNRVILGETPLTANILRQEFPDLERVSLPPYGIRYSARLPLWWKLLADAPRLFGVIRQERNLLEGLVKEYALDAVFSDNRFGLYHPDIRSVIMTHQVFLKAPLGQRLAQGINQRYLRRFDEIVVPDYPEALQSLSADLSHGDHAFPSLSYIGPQSRFQPDRAAWEKRFDYLFLLSGPEPQRSLLEQLLLRRLPVKGRTALIRGSTLPLKTAIPEGITVFDLPPSDTLRELILQSETIICRSGYSTLMDLHVLGKQKLILIPTPGQTEQEYLAQHWQERFDVRVIRQDELKQSPLF